MKTRFTFCFQGWPQRRDSLSAGFTLLEMFLLVALIGLFTGIAINLVGTGFPGTLRSAKLEADVQKLNQLVALYLADGGALNGVNSEQAVLDHLKRARPTSETRTNLGVNSGRFIDVRLRVRTGNGRMPGGQSHRARWNTSTKRFDLITSGSGVDEFYLDESLSAASFPLDTRAKSIKALNSGNGWVWGDNASNPTVAYGAPATASMTGSPVSFDPSADVPTGNPGGGSGGSGSGGGGGGEEVTPTTSQLPTPIITPSGGTFAYALFPTTATISGNNAPATGSSLVYRINGGAWQTYSSSISLSSGQRIEAKNISTSPLLYTDSSSTTQSYYRYVSGFTGSSSSNWTNVTGDSTLVYGITGDGTTTTLTHGDPNGTTPGGEAFPTGSPNVLSFTNKPFSAIQSNQSFTLGNLTFINGTTYNLSEATNATLQVQLNFSDPALSKVVDVNLKLVSTDHVDGDRLASADTVELVNPSPVTVTIDGVTYTLQLSWVTLDPGAGVVQGNKLLVFEGASATAQLRAKLVPNR